MKKKQQENRLGVFGMKKLLIILCFCLLGGCGFKPMFTGGNTDIYVSPIDGINGIDLRNALNAQFGGQKNPGAEYTLVIKLDEPKTKYKALERTGDATWQEIILRAQYTLKYGDTEIARGVETASESYTFVRYLVAANASYNSAVQNTIWVLADKIGTRVIAETVKHSGDDK